MVFLRRGTLGPRKGICLGKAKFLSGFAACKSEVGGWDPGVLRSINKGWAELAHQQLGRIEATWLAQTGGWGKPGKALDHSACSGGHSVLASGY